MSRHVPAIRSENLSRQVAGTCPAMTVGRTSVHPDFGSSCTLVGRRLDISMQDQTSAAPPHHYFPLPVGKLAASPS